MKKLFILTILLLVLSGCYYKGAVMDEMLERNCWIEQAWTYSDEKFILEDNLINNGTGTTTIRGGTATTTFSVVCDEYEFKDEYKQAIKNLK